MFRDRRDAGVRMAGLLTEYASSNNTVVVGLARGGMVLAAEIAKKLHLPLDVMVPRKIGAPGNPEYALGAILEDGEGVFHDSAIAMLGLTRAHLRETIARERSVAVARLEKYRSGRAPLDVRGKTVLVVDDGIATGATMEASLISLRKKGAKTLVVVAPVASREAAQRVQPLADRVIVHLVDPDFFGVSAYYAHFAQTEDTEVIQALAVEAE